MSLNNKKITVIAPARLHMGFLDLSGALNRHFGSIGVAIEELFTQVTITASEKLTVTGENAERAEHYVKTFCQTLGVSEKLNVSIDCAIPEHIGLGSGTQMALAIGWALNQFYEKNLDIQTIATLTNRGLRSGIGINIFKHGGFVVDGGRGENTIIPPLLARFAIPESWRFILVFDKRGQGLHGQQEIQAFKNLPHFDRREAEKLSYLLLMQGLPAIAEQNLSLFGDFISQFQNAIGKHFAQAQGGLFTSREVESAIQFLGENGAVGLGQTSWGPTGFCIVENEVYAQNLIKMAETRFAEFQSLHFLIVRANNQGHYFLK